MTRYAVLAIDLVFVISNAIVTSGVVSIKDCKSDLAFGMFLTCLLFLASYYIALCIPDRAVGLATTLFKLTAITATTWVRFPRDTMLFFAEFYLDDPFPDCHSGRNRNVELLIVVFKVQSFYLIFECLVYVYLFVKRTDSTEGAEGAEGAENA